MPSKKAVLLGTIGIGLLAGLATLFLVEFTPQVKVSSPRNGDVLQSKTIEFRARAEGLKKEKWSYSWDFGDGKGKSAKQNPTYTYGKPGTYTVSLIATQGKKTVEKSVTITVKNAPPVAVISVHDLCEALFANETKEEKGESLRSGITCGEAPFGVQFDGSKSSDDDGFIVSYNWDFGDGESSRGKRPTHIYVKPGKYTIVLTVKDDNGAMGQGKKTIDVYKPTGGLVSGRELLCWLGYNYGDINSDPKSVYEIMKENVERQLNLTTLRNVAFDAYNIEGSDVKSAYDDLAEAVQGRLEWALQQLGYPTADDQVTPEMIDEAADLIEKNPNAMMVLRNRQIAAINALVDAEIAANVFTQSQGDEVKSLLANTPTYVEAELDNIFSHIKCKVFVRVSEREG